MNSLAPYEFPILPGYTLQQTWSWAPVNAKNMKYDLIYANNRCYAYFLVNSGQYRAPENATRVSIVAPEDFQCPYKFLT